MSSDERETHPAGDHRSPAGSRRAGAVASLLALVLVAGACGNDSDSVVTTTPTSPSSPAVVEGGETADLDVQGHRGARGLQPENTLPAFEVALDLGVTTLELDLHLSADDEVVVWHDADVDGSKCGVSDDAPADVPDPDTASEDELMIRRLTSTQLRWFRCDRNPDPGRYPDQQAAPTAFAGDDYGIVTLSELFEFVAAYATFPDKSQEQRANAAAVRFNIETKRKPDRPETIGDGFDGTNAATFELAVLEAIEAAGLTDRVTVQSFDHRSLWAIRAVDPDVALVALSTRESVDHADLAARGASVWSPNQDVVGPNTIAAARRAGLLVIPWTVNDPDDMMRLIDFGVDGIITDRPDLLLELLAGG